ncbi:kinase-like protein [Dacryopinax primogenitus]|uniref:Kinase-like protein n=1 Tax=Dacryopinax primogenitus (strain DJM 731) TaxID=1858805 RepID=M5FVS5_DACPD|nr:kinase-like protein [Dacryopinax primogenitus]EJU01941.1 kinase-like protein [Dacryopinax primogenitus]
MTSAPPAAASRLASLEEAVSSKLETFVLTIAGVSDAIHDRQDSLLQLSARCKAIEEELDHRSAGLRPAAVQRAIEETKQFLKEIWDGCQSWLNKGKLKRLINTDVIHRAVQEWNDKLNERMQDFARSIVFEVLSLTSNVSDQTSRFYVQLLQQGETFTALLKSVERTTELTQSQIREFMDQGQRVQMRSQQISPQERGMLYDSLCSILSKSKKRDILPIVEIQGELEIDESSLSEMHWFDMYRGTWQGRMVAVKRLRYPNANQLRLAKFMYEGYVWRMLDHPNVLPFFGIHTGAKQEVGLVTVWMPQGNVMQYIARKPVCDRKGIIRGAADGLAYLHRRKIVHGDIRGSKILIEEVLTSTGVQPHTRLSDFGLAAPPDSDQEALYQGTSIGQMVTIGRWIAPERGRPGTLALPVPASDVFSFGRTVLEVTTGEKPFASEKNVFYLIFCVGSGQLRPERPEEGLSGNLVTNEVWELLENMCEVDPQRRRSMADVQTRLEELL